MASPEKGEDTLQISEVKEAEGRYPSQIVLRQVKPGTYATHIKVLPPDSDPYFILGRYFFKLEDAEADFQKRTLELDGPQSGSVRN
jgi:hypothetical protein